MYEDPKLEFGDHVSISKYKNFFESFGLHSKFV